MDHLNIGRFLKVWAEILSDHYSDKLGVDVTIKLTATKKEEIAERGLYWISLRIWHT